MRKKAASRDGADRTAEQFIYTQTPFGVSKAWTGVAAAEPYWCLAHEHTKATPGTKVCVRWYTDGALSCPRCRPALVPTRIGYVPIWREIDHKPCLVIVHESVEDLLRGVEFGVRVLVGCVERGSSVFVRPTEEQPRWVSEHPLRQRPADISLSLYTVWAYPALNEWDQRKEKPPAVVEKVNAAELPAVSDKAVSFPHNRFAVHLENEARKLDTAAEAARRSAEFVKEQGKDATNGKHTKNGGE